MLQGLFRKHFQHGDAAANRRIPLNLHASQPQMQQLRGYQPIAGPPRFPMSQAKQIIIGGGCMLLMMILPYWCLFQIPLWSALHRGVPLSEIQKKKETEEEEAAEQEEEDKKKKK